MMIPLDFQILPVFHRFFSFLFTKNKAISMNLSPRQLPGEERARLEKWGQLSEDFKGQTGGKSSDPRETFGRWFGFLVVVEESSTFLIKDMNVYYIYII